MKENCIANHVRKLESTDPETYIMFMTKLADANLQTHFRSKIMINHNYDLRWTPVYTASTMIDYIPGFHVDNFLNNELPPLKLAE